MAYSDNPLSLPTISPSLAGWDARVQQALELLAPLHDLYNGSTLILTTHSTYMELKKPIQLASYAKASLPSVSPAGQMIYVTDETGGAVPAFSDGTNWRRVQDRNVVS